MSHAIATGKSSVTTSTTTPRAETRRNTLAIIAFPMAVVALGFLLVGWQPLGAVVIAFISLDLGIGAYAVGRKRGARAVPAVSIALSVIALALGGSALA